MIIGCILSSNCVTFYGSYPDPSRESSSVSSESSESSNSSALRSFNRLVPRELEFLFSFFLLIVTSLLSGVKRDIQTIR